MTLSFKTLAFHLAIAAFVHAAVAGDLDSEPSANHRRVSYSDLDLRSDAGVQSLLARIERAALKVCGKPTGSKLLPRESSQLITCRESTVEQAVASLNQPAITQAYQKRAAISDSALANR